MYYDFYYGYDCTVVDLGFYSFKIPRQKSHKMPVLCTKCYGVYYISYHHYKYYASRFRRLCKKCQNDRKSKEMQRTTSPIAERNIHPTLELTLHDPYAPCTEDNPVKLYAPSGIGEHWGLMIGMR